METRLRLKKKSGAVSEIDGGSGLGYSKARISRAVSVLKSNGFITVDAEGHLEFTDEGLARANEVYEKHRILTRFLCSLGVPEEVAEQDACRIEHVISDESFAAIKNSLDK